MDAHGKDIFEFFADGGWRMLAFVCSLLAAGGLGQWAFHNAHRELGGAWREKLGRVLVPNAITALRLALGVVVAVAFLVRETRAAVIIYLAGLATDLFDGVIARALRAKTDWGAEFDRRTDIAFSTTVTLAYVSVAPVWEGACIIAIPLALTVITRAVWGVPHPIHKMRAGACRLVVLAFLLQHLGTAERMATLVLLATGMLYEILIMRREKRKVR